MSKSLPLIVLGVVILGGLAVAGRSLGRKASEEAGENLAERAIEAASGGQATIEFNDESSANVSIETDRGTATFGAGTNLPAGFPSDVPTPENATLTSSFSGSESDKTSYSLVYTVPRASAEARAAYQAQLEGAGFIVTSSGTAATGGNAYSGLEASKGSTKVSVAIAGNNSQTTLTIVVVVE